MAMTFLGCPEDRALQVNHKDGNKLNNHPSNLEWVTQRENLGHAWEHGLRQRPERPKKITEEQAREIYTRALSGTETLKQIAADYPVTLHTVHQIKHRRQWRAVTA